MSKIIFWAYYVLSTILLLCGLWSPTEIGIHTILAVIGGILIFGSIRSVDQQHIASVRIFGAYARTARPGIAFVPLGIGELVPYPGGIIQLIFGPPDKDPKKSEHGEPIYFCELGDIQFAEKPLANETDKDDPRHKVPVAVPTLSIKTKIANLCQLETIGGLGPAIDIACEGIWSSLQALVRNSESEGGIGEGKSTLKHFIDMIGEFEENLSNDHEVLHELNQAGLELFGEVSIADAGVPPEITQALQDISLEAARTLAAKQQGERLRVTGEAEGDAARLRDQKRAPGIQEVRKAEAAGQKLLVEAYKDELGRDGATQVLAASEMTKNLTNATTVILGQSGVMPQLPLPITQPRGPQQPPSKKGKKTP